LPSKNVSFSYEAGKQVLQQVSFLLGAGAPWTALVGSSGSGKSTIIGLVAAFHVPLERPPYWWTAWTWQPCAWIRTARAWVSSCRSRSCSMARIRENVAFRGPRAKKKSWPHAGSPAWTNSPNAFRMDMTRS